MNTTKWVYELIDGDRKTDDRSTGDVAFHLAAYVAKSTTHIIYDSVLVINQKRDITSGEIRYASRDGVSPNSWRYKTLDQADNGVPVAGFDVAIGKEEAGIRMVWIAASASSTPVPNQIRSTFVGNTERINTANTDGFGTPGASITLENGELIFNCELRLCSMNLTKANNPIRLVSSTQTKEPGRGVFVAVDKKRFLLASIGRRIVFIAA